MDNLVRFMQDLVSHPEKLRLYKQNPAAYLAQPDLDLDQADQELLLKFSFDLVWKEISTVFTLNVTPAEANISPSSASNHIKDLKDLKVQLFCTDSSLIIDPSDQVEVQLLPESSIEPSDQDFTFNLFVKFTYQKDPMGRSFVFRMSAGDQPLVPDTPRNLVSLHIHKPFILVYDQSPTLRTLKQGSYYDYETRSLTLVFNEIPSPPNHD